MKKSETTPNKRVLLLVSGVCMVVMLVLGGIAAYAAMTAKDERTNLFQIGTIATEVGETFTTPSAPVEPNVPVPKKVRVTNTGTLNQFVRVMVQPEILGTTIGSSTDSVMPSRIGEEVLLDLNTTDWLDGEDGYYYYLKALEPGDDTSYLFTTVTLVSSLSDSYTNATFTLTIKVEVSNCGGGSGGYGIYQDAWWQGSIPSTTPLSTINTALQTELD